MSFYDEMAEMVDDLLQSDPNGGLGQGTIILKRETPGMVDPDQSWVPAEPTIETWLLKAVAQRLHQRYENGALIVETGDMVTFAVPNTVPAVTDKLVIDGAERAITNLTPLPPAGTTVAWKAWCAA